MNHVVSFNFIIMKIAKKQNKKKLFIASQLALCILGMFHHAFEEQSKCCGLYVKTARTYADINRSSKLWKNNDFPKSIMFDQAHFFSCFYAFSIEKESLGLIHKMACSFFWIANSL